jgi:hypothetical protein
MGEHRRNLAEVREWHQKWETIGRNLEDVRDRCQRLLAAARCSPSGQGDMHGNHTGV